MAYSLQYSDTLIYNTSHELCTCLFIDWFLYLFVLKQWTILQYVSGYFTGNGVILKLHIAMNVTLKGMGKIGPINGVVWHAPKTIFTESDHDVNFWNEFEK